MSTSKPRAHLTKRQHGVLTDSLGELERSPLDSNHRIGHTKQRSSNAKYAAEGFLLSNTTTRLSRLQADAQKLSFPTPSTAITASALHNPVTRERYTTQASPRPVRSDVYGSLPVAERTNPTSEQPIESGPCHRPQPYPFSAVPSIRAMNASARSVSNSGYLEMVVSGQNTRPRQRPRKVHAPCRPDGVDPPSAQARGGKDCAVTGGFSHTHKASSRPQQHLISAPRPTTVAEQSKLPIVNSTGTSSRAIGTPHEAAEDDVLLAAGVAFAGDSRKQAMANSIPPTIRQSSSGRRRSVREIIATVSSYTRDVDGREVAFDQPQQRTDPYWDDLEAAKPLHGICKDLPASSPTTPGSVKRKPSLKKSPGDGVKYRDSLGPKNVKMFSRPFPCTEPSDKIIRYDEDQQVLPPDNAENRFSFYHAFPAGTDSATRARSKSVAFDPECRVFGAAAESNADSSADSEESENLSTAVIPAQSSYDRLVAPKKARTESFSFEPIDTISVAVIRSSKEGLRDLDAIPSRVRATKSRRGLFDQPNPFSDPEKERSPSIGPECENYEPEPTTGRRSSCVLINRRKSIYSVEEEKAVRKVGKKRLKWTKWFIIFVFVLGNSTCITITWMYPKYWWVFVPVILLGNVLNSCMTLNILRWFLWGQIMSLVGKKPPPRLTEKSTTIAMVLACYCESYDDIMATMLSLNEQDQIDHHKKMFIIVCDGMVKGKGAEKSTDRILVEDILKPEKEEFFATGYESWDGAINGIYASSGYWRGTPFVCLVKKRNLGKRDGLILVRSLLYKYSQRHDTPISTMGPAFFGWFSDFSEDCGFHRFEWLVGVDADTTFNRTCVYEMHKECLKDPRLVGCSGLIQVGFRTGQWNLWNLYQNTEYIRAQLLRRWHQAHGTGKVSCLPGACQIIKVCEETCGDAILIDLFGQLPDPKANMVHQIRALAGEDRNFIVLIFFRFPYSQTTMSLNAIAYTDPPNGLWVFLSQRKRWTLSTCANDILIVCKSEMNWFERCCSAADVITWFLPVFVAQTVALFIKACVNVEDPTFIVCFAVVTMIPLLYALIATFWGCRTTRLKIQYLCGLVMLVLMGQFVTPVVIAYAIWHMDDFSWGKTREVEVSDDPDSKPAHSE